MEQVMITLLDLSISVTWLILAVLAFRFLFKKAPKQILCVLWCLVGLRLVIPVSVESTFSLAPDLNRITGYLENGLDNDPEADAYVYDMHTAPAEASEKETPDSVRQDDPLIGTAPAEPGQELTLGRISLGWALILRLFGGWLLGVALMACYVCLSYIRLWKRLDTAVLLQENIWQSEYVDSPFILGIIKPRIYIPYHLDEDTLPYVLAHERAHLARKDHWIKLIAFLILGVYWFHPLVWLSYSLLCKDMEMACDERVISGMDAHEKKQYCYALLFCGGKRRVLQAACPLSFGEVSVKERIRRVKAYQKPGLRLMFPAVFAAVIVAVCFLTSPQSAGTTDADRSQSADVLTSEEIMETPDGDSLTEYDFTAILSGNLGAAAYDPHAGFAGGYLFGPDAYEIYGAYDDAPDAWKAAGYLCKFYTENMLAWDGNTISDVYLYSNYTSMETIRSIDGLCAPAILVLCEYSLYTASSIEALEASADENGMITAEDGRQIPLADIEMTSEYYCIFLAEKGEEYGYVLALNTKNFTEEDIIAYAKTIDYAE